MREIYITANPAKVVRTPLGVKQVSPVTPGSIWGKKKTTNETNAPAIVVSAEVGLLPNRFLKNALKSIRISNECNTIITEVVYV